MLTKTSEYGVRVLLFLSTRTSRDPITPKAIAQVLDLSPTYLAKITRLLAKAGLVSTRRGARGGVILAQAPEAISLLSAVQACQGRIVPDTCIELPQIGGACAFHAAMFDLHQAVVGSLSRWTLRDVMTKPRPEDLAFLEHCKIHNRGPAAHEVPSSRRPLARRAA